MEDAGTAETGGSYERAEMSEISSLAEIARECAFKLDLPSPKSVEIA